MAFLKDIGKSIGKTAKSVTKKSEELVEITKLNLSIGSEEDKIKKLLLELGSELYGKFSRDEAVEECFIDKCTQIKTIENTIESLKEKIQCLKGNECAHDCECRCNEEKSCDNDSNEVK